MGSGASKGSSNVPRNKYENRRTDSRTRKQRAKAELVCSPELSSKAGCLTQTSKKFVRKELLRSVRYTFHRCSVTQHFDALRVIGEGNFGTVRLLRWKHQKKQTKDEVDISCMSGQELHGNISEGSSEVSNATTCIDSTTGGSNLQRAMLKKRTEMTEGETLFAGKTMPRPGSPGWRDGNFEVEEVANELRVMQHLRHPNVVTLFRVYESAHNYTFVLEYADGNHLRARIESSLKRRCGDAPRLQLSQENDRRELNLTTPSTRRCNNFWCGTLSERECAFIIADMAAGLAYLHARGIAHRDLKPENLLFRTKNEYSDLMIADFGFAKKLPEEGYFSSFCGSPSYMAPEVIGNKVIVDPREMKQKRRYGVSCDIWSAGIILYEILSGTNPFQGNKSKETMKNIKQLPLQFLGSTWSSISNQAKRLCQRLLQKTPEKRPTATEVLLDPFVVNNVPERVAIRLHELLEVKEAQDLPKLVSKEAEEFLIQLEAKLASGGIQRTEKEQLLQHKLSKAAACFETKKTAIRDRAAEAKVAPLPVAKRLSRRQLLDEVQQWKARTTACGLAPRMVKNKHRVFPAKSSFSGYSSQRADSDEPHLPPIGDTITTGR